MFGRKIGMTQIFGPDQDLMPVTVLEVGPSFVSQVKTSATDGYAAVQVASEPKKKFSRPSEGHLKKAGLAPGFSRFLEFRTTDPSAFSPGAPVELSLFKEGEWVDVIARTKGKGFQGVVKRHGFAGGGASHGCMTHRRGGSYGMRTRPGTILKNQKMPGHAGHRSRTVQNLIILKVVPEKNVLVVKGSVPGFNGALVVVRKAKKAM